MKNTDVITAVQHEGLQAGETGGGDSDLHGTVQNTGDELDQLLHGLSRLAGQEVLLVGCVEDDDGGDGHLAGKKTPNRVLKWG